MLASDFLRSAAGHLMCLVCNVGLQTFSTLPNSSFWFFYCQPGSDEEDVEEKPTKKTKKAEVQSKVSPAHIHTCQCEFLGSNREPLQTLRGATPRTKQIPVNFYFKVLESLEHEEVGQQHKRNATCWIMMELVCFFSNDGFLICPRRKKKVLRDHVAWMKMWKRRVVT